MRYKKTKILVSGMARFISIHGIPKEITKEQLKDFKDILLNEIQLNKKEKK